MPKAVRHRLDLCSDLANRGSVCILLPCLCAHMPVMIAWDEHKKCRSCEGLEMFGDIGQRSAELLMYSVEPFCRSLPSSSLEHVFVFDGLCGPCWLRWLWESACLAMLGFGEVLRDLVWMVAGAFQVIQQAALLVGGQTSLAPVHDDPEHSLSFEPAKKREILFSEPSVGRNPNPAKNLCPGSYLLSPQPQS